jgi:photosystem II stability/assembly factor-like uncharacterized protein
VSLTSAYVAADAPFHGGRQLDVTPLWLTTDAGATWLARTIPCRSIDGSLIMSVAPQGAAFDVCASEPGAGSQLKAVLESTDAGRHWTFRSQCRFDPYLTCNPTSQTPGYVSQIDAVSPTTIFQVGGRADPSVSHDAGRTWRNVSAVGTASGGGTAQVAFFNTDDGVVLGEEYRAPGFISELWETTDAGAHWAPRIPVAS